MPKTQSNDPETEYKAWMYKILYLKESISKIETIEGVPVISISIFLLKSQLVEFEIKQLITSLDLHVASSNSSNLLKLHIRTPIEFDSEKYSLGTLIEVLRRFISPQIGEIIQYLLDLNGLRKVFTHKLFDSTIKMGQLETDSKRGIDLSNKLLDKIEELEKSLK